MADGAVRKAIQQFFSSPEIDGIQRVYKDVPWFLDGARWEVYDQRGWAAVCAVHLTSSRESRVTLPWKDGSKQVNHTVGMIIQYQYLIPTQFTFDEAEDSWIEGLDSIVDGIKNRIRSDYTMGNTDVIFQAGQNPNDIRIQRDVPIIDKGRIVSWNVVEFDVTEIIQA